MILLNGGWLDGFWEWIKPVDAWLLFRVNQGMQSDTLDSFLPFFRETSFWIPLYLFLLVFILQNFGMKGIWWSLGVVLTAALSDLVSSQLIKETIWRVRPCQDPDIGARINFIINYCPTSSSFTSSHATTHFAQATFFYLTLRHTGKWWILAYAWAFLIGFSQVYVAVHYPFDVICGALIGCLVGFAVSRLFHRQFGVLQL